jgi:S-adenosylmethionine-diacylglycerol 3-amino-3-carboxypropyl transferase
MSRTNRALDQLNDHLFNSIYSRSLVYNSCWEDPAIDRQVLNIGPDDHVMVITSAGCNVLDYVLTNPAQVYAVDMNPRQNALLELKMAGIRSLQFEDYFSIFGTGQHPDFERLYSWYLRRHLGEYSRNFWDRHTDWFAPGSGSGGFYFHGLSGSVARMFHWYLKTSPRLKSGISALLEADSLEEQRDIYDTRVQGYLWSRKINWLISRQLTMNLLGVPHAQRKEVENQHVQGVAGFIRESIEYVFRQIPLSENYFWRLYLEGRYSRQCCPEYLKKENFYRLKDGLVDRITIKTDSVTGFLQSSHQQMSRLVLLDHMDWMSTYRPDLLMQEWRAIFDNIDNNTRIIFRSAHRWPTYLQNLVIPGESDNFMLMERLRFHPGLASSLMAQDRVHTYAGFHIADVIL